MIPARHNAFYVSFFNYYSRWMIHSHFRKTKILNQVKAENLPVLMIGNHFSWWDGFIADYINQSVFRKRLHIMMLEEQLKPRMFLNKAGAYSIKKGSRDALTTLNYTAGLMEDAGNLAVVYPQGEFESIYRHPVTFDKGIEVIGRKLIHDIQLIFYAALTDYFSYRKPTLSIYLKEVPQSLASNVSALESSYNTFLKECHANQKPA